MIKSDIEFLAEYRVDHWRITAPVMGIFEPLVEWQTSDFAHSAQLAAAFAYAIAKLSDSSNPPPRELEQHLELYHNWLIKPLDNGNVKLLFCGDATCHLSTALQNLSHE